MRRVRKRSRMRELLFQRRESVDADGPAAELLRRVRHRLPQVAAKGPAEEHEEAVAVLAQHVAGGAGHGAGAECARRRRLRAQVQRAEAGEQLARERARDRERGVGGGHVDRAFERWNRSPDHKRAIARDGAPPGAVAALCHAQFQVVWTVQLQLGEVGAVGEDHAIVCLMRVAHGDVPTVTQFEARASSRSLALHWAAGNSRLRVHGKEVEACHERSTSPSGSKNGRVTTCASSVRPWSEMTMRAPSPVSTAGTQAIPIVRPSWRDQRALVTCPAGAPPSPSTAAPSVGTSPFGSVKPTSAVSGGCAAARWSAHLPMKSSSLSSFTIQGIAAP